MTITMNIISINYRSFIEIFTDDWKKMKNMNKKYMKKEYMKKIISTHFLNLL